MALSTVLGQLSAYLALPWNPRDKIVTSPERRFASSTRHKQIHQNRIMASTNSSPSQTAQNLSHSPGSDRSYKRNGSPSLDQGADEDEERRSSPPRKKVRFLEASESDVESESEPDSPSASPASPNVDLTASSDSGLTKTCFWKGEAPVEEHAPGISDIMTGGIGTFSPPRQATPYPASISTDDVTVSRLAIEQAVVAMPYCILDRERLEELGLFQTAFPENIPDQFQTTYLGVQRALHDAYESVFRGGKCGSKAVFDRVLLKEIWRRAGWFEKERSVNYVEEMTPVVGYGEEGFDGEYWGMVWSQGTVWREIEMEEEEGEREKGEDNDEENGDKDEDEGEEKGNDEDDEDEAGDDEDHNL